MAKGKRRTRWQRTRDGAAVAWRFRYHFLCAALALVFWESLLIKPFRVFVVMVHEVCHAAATLGTGGAVVEMRTAWDESGHTVSEGGWYYPAASMLLPPSAFFLIGFLIWAIRSWRTEQAEESEFQAQPSERGETAR